MNFDEGQNRSGWYVVCNGRIVLAADKTSITGWGTEAWPQWHPQYTGFMGIIFFSSRRADVLPLTTTKRSVDVNLCYIPAVFALKMRETTKKWIFLYQHQKTNQRGSDKARESCESGSNI